MSTITRLPKEVLLLIFKKLDNLTHLAECRRVCQSWSPLAEIAMLHTITITSNAAKMGKLFAYLQANPPKTRLIKHLDFNVEYPFNSSKDILELLKLIVTPSIESITGFTASDTLIDTLTDIVETTPNKKLDRLKTLAIASWANPPLKLALYCKETIQSLELDFENVRNGIDWNFMGRLSEFHHLTTLTLTAAIGIIEKLDKVLDDCPHLQELALKTFGWHYDDEDDALFNLNLQAFKRNYNLKTLKIGSNSFCSSFLIEYLVSKFVNLGKICIDTYADQICDDYVDHTVRIPKLIQKVPQRELIYTVITDIDLGNIVHYLKEAGCTIKVEDVDNYNNIRIRVVL